MSTRTMKQPSPLSRTAMAMIFLASGASILVTAFLFAIAKDNSHLRDQQAAIPTLASFESIALETPMPTPMLSDEFIVLTLVRLETVCNDAYVADNAKEVCYRTRAADIMATVRPTSP